VGAGAVVTRDVVAYGLVVGNPARQVGFVCECGQKLLQTGPSEGEAHFACPSCEREYSFKT